MIRICLLLLITSVSMAHASEIVQAYKAKKTGRIIEIYRANPKRAYTKKEFIVISYALRKQGLFKADILVNVRMIKKEFAKEHKKILADIKKGATIDADSYSKLLKHTYWNLMNDYGRIMQGYKSVSEINPKDREHYAVFSKILSELEFREGQVDKLNDKITAHIQYVQNRVYRFTYGFSLQYLSWQQQSILEGAGSSTNLIVTNKGYCAGGELGMENYLFHFSLDACFLLGSGGVSSAGSAINYQQSNVPAYGVKAGPGVSMIVSSSKSRIGIKVPIVYNLQELAQPNQAGYEVKTESPLSIVTSLYSRWQFDSFYIQTEFGQYVGKDETLWSLGIGKSF